MAYMNQEKKAVIKKALDAALTGTGIKYSLGVHAHLSIVCTLRSGPVDFMANYLQVAEERRNPYMDCIISDATKGHIQVNHHHLDHGFSGEALAILQRVRDALNTGNWDRSDSMTDYFDVGHYVDLDIGRWDKPYVLTGDAGKNLQAA